MDNPVKTVIFYLSLFFVSFFWMNFFTAMYKRSDERKSKIIITITFVFTIMVLALSILLTYYIPYSVWWLMNYWRW